MIESYGCAGIYIEGTAINLHNQQQSLKAIFTEVRNGRSSAFHTLNLDRCIKVRQSETFRNSYSKGKFAARATGKLEGCDFICIGVALDFIAGAQVRASEIFRRLGFEWVWRLVINPLRIGRRYLKCASLLSVYLVRAVARRTQKRAYVGCLPTQAAR